jgi:hypothetical protein
MLRKLLQLFAPQDPPLTWLAARVEDPDDCIDKIKYHYVRLHKKKTNSRMTVPEPLGLTYEQIKKAYKYQYPGWSIVSCHVDNPNWTV